MAHKPHSKYRNWPMAESVAARLDKSAPNGCWNWTGYVNKCGYGLLGKQNKLYLAHRVAYELAHGAIPAGLEVCHRCDNPKCANPDHLFVATHKANMEDMVAKGRGNKCRGETHGAAKLTEAQAREIIVAPGRHADLAAQYGVAPSHISNIKCGRVWKLLHRSGA